jgi:3',5'-cyclic AMP phosphodiesterase CpdA
MRKFVFIFCVTALVACAKPPIRQPSLPSGAEPIKYTGVVFNDRNRNGVRDAGEPGIEGVKVSNGIDVVMTDERGRYALTVDDDTILFVIKPRDWMTPTDQNHLPRFYYIHKPSGSPDQNFLYKGVEPTGPLPESVNFPFYRRPEPDRFDVIVFADPQPYSTEQLALLARDTVSELIGTDAAFGLSLGDLVGDDLNLMNALNETVGLIGIPWYNLPGNHDQNYMSNEDANADETFERIYGPSTYAFQYGSVHFVMLDDVIWKGFSGFRKNGLPQNFNYEGGLNADQLSFLRNYVATVPEGDLLVLCMHIPLDGYENKNRVPQKDRILDILHDHPHTLYLSGHTHIQRHWFMRHPDGTYHHFNTGTVSGSWYAGAFDEVGIPHTVMRDGTPNGYATITFDGTDYTIRFKASRWPRDYQMNIYSPDRVTPVQLADGIEVFVNVFAGSERSVVEMRVGQETPWLPLHRAFREDPFYRDLFNRELRNASASLRGMPKPVPSSHLWVGTLPGTLPIGAHVIEVRTRDMFGQKYQDRRPILVE